MKIVPNSQNFNLLKVPQNDAKKNAERPVEKPVDKYIPSEEERNVTYERPSYKADTAAIARLKAESERVHEQLRNLVRQLLEKQGITLEDVKSGNREFVVDEDIRLEAQAAIAEGGPLSPESVSDRIVDFAKAISGGDKSKFGLLRNAIEEGFSEAAKALGGALPEISQKTYDLVMEKLNAWADEA